MSDPVTRLNAALEGRYAIARELGEGGMATVYLADDLKHERKVALKVLKPELAAVVGAERFLAEIKVTANLQHPHILPLHDSGEADTFLFYVMPYVEGETLRDRIDREKQLPVDEAVALASKVAGALQHAHEHGVIHRDIKPGNILLQSGEPVVSDFGIALALGVAGGTRLTETGLSVGTPFYMSPEQATGDQVVGASTDTYALGSVLYEMLVGEPPYPGTTAQAVLGKIIAGKPVSAIEERPSIPANVDAAVRKALEKLPADRFASAQKFVWALGNEHFRYGALATASAGGAAGPWNRLTTVGWSLAAVTTLIAGWALLRPEPPQPVTRQILSTERWSGLQAPLGRVAALAPDGSSMVLPIGSGAGDRQLALKMRSSIEITPIPGTEQALEVVYSPDAQWIAYQVGTDVLKRPLVGGAPVTLAEDANPSGVSALAWLDDRSILYEAEDESNLERLRWIARISEDGEPLGIVFGPEEEQVAPAWARGLPGARGALVIGCPGTVSCFAENANLYVVDLDDLSWEIALEQVMRAWYAPPGHIVYVRADGAVFAQPFDPTDLELTGSVIPLFDGVRVPGTWADMLLGADGTLLYVEGAAAGGGSQQVVRVERDGTARAIDPGWSLTGVVPNSGPALSPEGTRLALSILDSEGGSDVWVKQLDTGPLSRLTLEIGGDTRPTWSPDGQSLTFVSNRAGNLDVWTKRADGSDTAELVLDRDLAVQEAAYSPDGTWLLFREGANQAAGIYAARLPMDSAAVPMEVTEFQERAFSLSPDGRWLAFVSNRTGSNEIFVRPFPDAGASLQQVSANGGREPVWAHSGRELFYVNGSNELVAVQVSSDPGFAPGQQEVLFSVAGYMRNSAYAMYDVTPDDQRFVMLRFGDDVAATTAEVVLVTNFFEELKRLVPN